MCDDKTQDIDLLCSNQSLSQVRQSLTSVRSVSQSKATPQQPVNPVRQSLTLSGINSQDQIASGHLPEHTRNHQSRLYQLGHQQLSAVWVENSSSFTKGIAIWISLDPLRIPLISLISTLRSEPQDNPPTRTYDLWPPSSPGQNLKQTPPHLKKYPLLCVWVGELVYWLINQEAPSITNWGSAKSSANSSGDCWKTGNPA